MKIGENANINKNISHIAETTYPETDIKNKTNTKKDTDKLEISDEYTDEYENRVGLREFFNELKKNFPNVNFFMGSFADCKYADKNGISIVLSSSFVENLVSGGEEGEKCRDIISKVLEELKKVTNGKTGTGVFIDDEKAVFWELNKTQKEDIKNPQKNQLNSIAELLKRFDTMNQKNENKNKQSSTLNNVSGLYALAAMARNKSGVLSVVAKANMQIASLKVSASGASKSEAAKMNNIVKSLKKLIAKCSAKMRKIEKAEQAENDYRQARKKKIAKKVEHKRKEAVRRRKVVRSYSEGIKNIGMLEDWKNASSAKLIDQMEQFVSIYTPDTSAYTGYSGGITDTAVPTESITVTGTMTF